MGVLWYAMNAMARLEDLYEHIDHNGGTITKSEIRQLLDNVRDSFFSREGRFFQVSGMIFWFLILIWIFYGMYPRDVDPACW